MFARLLIALALCAFAFGSPVVQRATTPPTIVLVPGAWHLKKAMSSFATALEDIGIPTKMWGLVTVDNASASIGDDSTAMVHEVLSPLIEKHGRDVIVYLHSYAGFPGSVAIAGLSKVERTKIGLKGGIVGIIYQSAFVPLEGQSLSQAIGGATPTWSKLGKDDIINVIDPIQVFYNNATAAIAKDAVKRYVRGQSAKSFNTSSAQPHYGDAAYDGKRYYIHTTYDNAIPLAAQKAFVANSGVKWNVYTLDWDHSPFLGEPAVLAQLADNIQKQIVATC